MKKLFKVIAVFVLATSAILNLVACNNQTGGSVNPCVHEWVVASTVVGTCSVEGKDEYECKKCDETKTESTGFGAHTTEQIFDGEYHWQVNTCEHENTPEKIAHSLTDGVCECGFYSIDKIVADYNALTVFEQGTNIHVEIDVDGEREFVLDFKDNVMKANNDNSFLYMIYEDGYLYQTYDGDAWRKVQASEFFGNEIKLVDVFAEMIYINPIISTLDVDFNWVESNKWEANFEGGGAKGKLTVITENGMVKKIDAKRVDSTVDNLLNMTFSYGTADVGEVPEIDYDNVNGGGDTDGPDYPNYTFEQIFENYNNLKVFENGQNYTVSIRMEDDEEDLAIFIVEDDVVKAEVYGSGVAYMLIEGDTVYMSQNEYWQKGDKDEFFAETFGDKGNTISALIEFLYFYDDTLVLPKGDYEEIENNKGVCEISSQNLKVIVTIKNGMVKTVEHFDNSTEERLWAFNFTYGNAEVGEVPTPDYENAEEMFHPSNTPIDQNLIEILDNMESIKAFDEDNNIKFKDYFYENSQWVLGEQIWIKGNDIYIPPYFYSDGGSSSLAYKTWLILDGDKVYFGSSRENFDWEEVHQYYDENGLEKTLELLEKAELSFQVFTMQEFAEEMFECDSIEDAKLMSGSILRSARSFLHYDQDGVEYARIDENKWQSGDIDGEIITVTTQNGFITEILYENASTNMPKRKRVFEYGTVELPEIPDYKTE